MRGGTVGSCVVSRSGTELETQLVAGACLERILRLAPFPPLTPSSTGNPLATANGARALWLLAVQHFVFQINLVSSTVLLCSVLCWTGPSECPCRG